MESMPRPTLETRRLVLRPFGIADAPDVHRLAGDRRIADTTLNIPHPYEESMAEQWIASQGPAYEAGRLVNFAITVRAGRSLIGSIGLSRMAGREAELGYWVGVPWWNRGYCTEAARAVVDYGFGELGLERIHAHRLLRNPASGRVLEKAGLRREGLARQAFRKDGREEDIVLYGILRTDWTPDDEAGARRYSER